MNDTPVWQIYNIPQPTGNYQAPDGMAPSLGANQLAPLTTESRQDKLKDASSVAKSFGADGASASLGDLAGMSKIGIGAKILGLI